MDVFQGDKDFTPSLSSVVRLGVYAFHFVFFVKTGRAKSMFLSLRLRFGEGLVSNSLYWRGVGPCGEC